MNPKNYGLRENSAKKLELKERKTLTPQKRAWPISAPTVTGLIILAQMWTGWPQSY